MSDQMSEPPQETPDKPVGLADSPIADEALSRVLAQLEETDESFLQLVTLTDEELVAYSDDPEEATPFGQWYSELSVEQQALAQTAALRTQTANDRFVLTREDDEADAVPLVPPEVLAVLRLKKVGTVALNATRVMEDDIAWAVYHVADGVWLRELVTRHGYHSFALLKPDVDEAETTLAWAGVRPDAQAAAEIDSTVALEDISDPGKLPFLAETTAMTTFVRLHPEGSPTDGDILMTHVRNDGSTFVSGREGEGVRYMGISGADLAEDFRAWKARW
ncbi:hypothetical protein IGS73_11015 [Janibacter indicus]|uniref:SseB protein N-terminal domain-containing protein n=1 Tax=Janibacter indicus TaxID=857417 RepID=A0A7L9IW96_9MICO|nr:hypothetical protein [Janibacter indicus]QOK21676.1 hypothetical protein IGS73_11015 [Janibacter indicus]